MPPDRPGIFLQVIKRGPLAALRKRFRAQPRSYTTWWGTTGTALPTFEKHLERILQRWTPTNCNARMEGLNGPFQGARARASGYRNTATFITMIHLIAAPLGNLFNSI